MCGLDAGDPVQRPFGAGEPPRVVGVASDAVGRSLLVARQPRLRRLQAIPLHRHRGSARHRPQTTLRPTLRVQRQGQLYTPYTLTFDLRANACRATATRCVPTEFLAVIAQVVYLSERGQTRTRTDEVADVTGHRTNTSATLMVTNGASQAAQ